jgi:hypothetical protein
MFRIYITNNTLVIYDKSEKEFRQKYSNFEQVGVCKDQDNLPTVVEKLKKQYNINEEIFDCHIKKKVGWKYWTTEVQEAARQNISKALSRYVKTKEHGENISKAKKIKSVATFAGRKHTEHTKKLMAFKRKGVDPIQGRKWMHNPLTGKEARGYELKEGMIWGRSPEAKEYANAVVASKKRKAKKQSST